MPDIDIALTDAEFQRLTHVARALGKTVEQLAADELRARYALSNTTGTVTRMRPAPQKHGETR